jgi:hypothetical protein
VFTAEDRTLLSLVCGYLGQAQRETALALQRAILGQSRLPTRFAVRYEPAMHPLEVGGDWYDIVELPDGRIGIMVGDCVGHDLGAATVMGQRQPDPGRHGPARVLGAGSRVRHGVLRHPRSGHRPAQLLQRRAPAGPGRAAGRADRPRHVPACAAIANAIEHGHHGLPHRQVPLRAVSAADQLRLTVSDTGRWWPLPPGDRSLRGPGISLMRALMHQLSIEPGPSGITSVAGPEG